MHIRLHGGMTEAYGPYSLVMGCTGINSVDSENLEKEAIVSIGETAYYEFTDPTSSNSK